MADFQISVHHPDFPDDTEFEVQGVGLVTNGGTATVTDAMQQVFEADSGQNLRKALEENPIIGVGKKKPNILTGARTPNEKRSDEVDAAGGAVVVEAPEEPDDDDEDAEPQAENEPQAEDEKGGEK